jgi:hypothetical protein
MIKCNDATKDCHKCRWWRGLANRNPGVRIPYPEPQADGRKFGFGKCLRPEGHCSPKVVR